MSQGLTPPHEDWQRRILLLRESAWRDADINFHKVTDWLGNFSGKFQPQSVEQQHAIHLLQNFIYYGRDEIKECMRALYRDGLLYPAVQALKSQFNDTSALAAAVRNSIEKETLFTGVGYASESGTYLLYQFRLANDLPTINLLTLDQAIKMDDQGNVRLMLPEMKRIVFLDDLCGSGDQVIARHREQVEVLRQLLPQIELQYLLLFGMASGLEVVRNAQLFDKVEAAIVLDDDYRAFGADSLCYRGGGLTREEGRGIAEGYGRQIYPSHPLGHRDSQLLVSFSHNTPDNTLPLFWCQEAPPWCPLFPRTTKK